METNETDEQTVTEISKLIERKKAAAYEEGFQEGYSTGRATLWSELSAFVERTATNSFPIPKSKRTRTAEPVAPKVENIEDAVREGLVTLANELSGGVEPQALAEFFKDAPVPIDVKQVRAALRQLTMTGEAHRVADGRYLPGPAQEPAVAETVE